MGGIGALLAPGPDQTLLRQPGQQQIQDLLLQMVLDHPGAELGQHGEVEAGVLQPQPERVGPREPVTTASAACRSVRFSAIWNTVTSARRPGDHPAGPVAPNACENSPSGNSSPSRSRTATGNGTCRP